MVTKANYIVGETANQELKDVLKAIAHKLKGARLMVNGGVDTNSVKEFGEAILQRDGKEISSITLSAGFEKSYSCQKVNPLELPAMLTDKDLKILTVHYCGKCEIEVRKENRAKHGLDYHYKKRKIMDLNSNNDIKKENLVLKIALLRDKQKKGLITFEEMTEEGIRLINEYES